MRLSYNLFFVATILIADSSNYVFATRNDIPNSISNIGISNLVPSTSTIDNNQPTRRGLRTNQLTDYKKEEEERMKQLVRVISDVTDKGNKAAVKLTRSKSLPGFTEKQKLERIMNEQAWVNVVYDKLATINKIHPQEAKERWGVVIKMKKLTTGELSIDPVYLFWKNYKTYWDNLPRVT